MLLRHLREAAFDLAKKKAPREERKRSFPTGDVTWESIQKFRQLTAKFRQRTATCHAAGLLTKTQLLLLPLVHKFCHNKLNAPLPPNNDLRHHLYSHRHPQNHQG